VLKTKADHFDTILASLKETYNNTEKRAKKLQCLTLVATIWSERKISEEFGTSRETARHAKNIFKENGILGDSEPKQG